MTISPTNELLSDDPFYTVVGNSIQGSYIPATSAGATGGSTSGSVMSVTSGGITINLVLDAAAQAAPASFKNGLQQAVSILAANITDKITVNINIDYSGTGGGAAAGPDSGYYENYSWVHSELVNNATAGDTTFNSLATGSSVQGQTNVAVWNAQLKLWGVLGANDTTTDDASANFATDINPNLLVGVALHELTHAMGRVPYGSAPDVFDLFRFTSPDVRLFQGGATAPAAYFSLDGGNTKLADYGQNSDPSDFLNSGVQGSNDPFNEYYTSTTIQGLTTVDLKQLDALGFHLAVNSPTTIESVGTTSLVLAGSNYFLNPTAGGGGPGLKYQGSLVVAGQFGSYVPIGGEQISGGYEVAWKNTATGQYSVWSTDANGNYTGNLYMPGSGDSTAFESLETSFHQDLNGDGVIGVPVPVVIEAAGSIELDRVLNHYVLSPVGGGTGTGIKLLYQASAVTVGEFGDYAPIGAEAISNGYEVAWRSATTGQFSVWSTDSNGNYTGNLYMPGSGHDAAFESLEPSFQQDLNGDGTVGIAGAAISSSIEAIGATALDRSGSNYLLDPVAGGTGPLLKYQGIAVAAGQFGDYAPIGAEPISNGYEVAWKNATTGQYSVWSTDSNGNYAGNLYMPGAGNTTAFEMLETSFHQDLNADGTIGVRSVIEAVGTTALVSSADNYLLNPVGGGTGATLKYEGAAVTAGQFGGYAPIGAEAVSNGYEVAWKNATTGQYSVWSTDTSGNYTGNFYMPGSGGTSAFESLEPSFQQDLNGDGTIGIPGHSTPVVAASVAGDAFTFASDPSGQATPSHILASQLVAAVSSGVISHVEAVPVVNIGELLAADGGHLAALFHDLLGGYILSH